MIKLSPQRVRAIVRKTLRSESAKAGEINVIFVGRSEIKRLNRRFLKESGETDVIAFPYSRHPGNKLSSWNASIQDPMGPGLRISRATNKRPSRVTVSGDIYICSPVAQANARRWNEPVQRELTRLVVHGTLHLLGYADEPARAKKKMWARQEPLVEALWNS